MQKQIGQMKASGSFVPNERIDVKREIIKGPNGIALPKFTCSTFGNVNEIIIQKIESCGVVAPDNNDSNKGSSNEFICINSRHILAINSKVK